jgi:L-fucose mutarotase
MLKGIPDIITPELLKILHEMGHGDELVIGDANFPAASNARNLVRCDGHGVPELLDAILTLFPLDDFVPHPVALMQVVPGDSTVPVIQDEIRAIVRKHEKAGDALVEQIERFAFYERARRAYAIVSTTEKKLYGCMIVKKGVIR